MPVECLCTHISFVTALRGDELHYTCSRSEHETQEAHLDQDSSHMCKSGVTLPIRTHHPRGWTCRRFVSKETNGLSTDRRTLYNRQAFAGPCRSTKICLAGSFRKRQLAKHRMASLETSTVSVSNAYVVKGSIP